jgi:methionyl-tRNA formyltransferase
VRPLPKPPYAAQPAEYGFTFHRVIPKLNAGPIILQVRCDEIDPRWPYLKVATYRMRRAAEHFWNAVETPVPPNITPTLFSPEKQRLFGFPTLEEASRYREQMVHRRDRNCAPSRGSKRR